MQHVQKIKKNHKLSNDEYLSTKYKDKKHSRRQLRADKRKLAEDVSHCETKG